MVYHGRDSGRWSASVHRVASRSAHIAVGAGHGRLSSTWLKYLGPGSGEGASLKGGSCAPVQAQQKRERRADRRGGTSRTGAKRAGECDGLTGLPEANAGGPGPQATVPTCAGTTRFRAPGCGSSPTGTAGRSRPLSRPICTAPNQEAAWQALTDFSESDMGVKHPSVGDDLPAGLGAIHPFFLDSPADAQACHLSPTSWEVPPPPTVSRLRATSCARITDEPRPFPLR